jgi:hypothetical protein
MYENLNPKNMKDTKTDYESWKKNMAQIEYEKLLLLERIAYALEYANVMKEK